MDIELSDQDNQNAILIDNGASDIFAIRHAKTKFVDGSKIWTLKKPSNDTKIDHLRRPEFERSQ